MSNATYTAVVKSTIEAVRADEKSGGLWKTNGPLVAEHFKTAERLEAIKAQFIADAILPALDSKHAAALAVELPRKGSKEFKELSEANQAKWEEANQAKKDARAVAHTYFARVLKYAFQKEKPETTEEEKAATNSLETKFNKVLSDLIGKCEKAENASFDVIKVKAALVAAQKLVNTPVNK